MPMTSVHRYKCGWVYKRSYNWLAEGATHFASIILIYGCHRPVQDVIKRVPSFRGGSSWWCCSLVPGVTSGDVVPLWWRVCYSWWGSLCWCLLTHVRNSGPWRWVLALVPTNIKLSSNRHQVWHSFRDSVIHTFVISLPGFESECWSPLYQMMLVCSSSYGLSGGHYAVLMLSFAHAADTSSRGDSSITAVVVATIYRCKFIIFVVICFYMKDSQFNL